MSHIGFLITGNEVINGKIKDTNGLFMTAHFRKIGIPICLSVFCPDEKQELEQSLQFLSDSCDTIIMTGGLGPTSDDLTAQVLAQFFGVELEFNEQAWDTVIQAFKKYGRTAIPESNKKQAMLPKNCQIIPNNRGSAAGFSFSGTINQKKITVYCLPGVPSEMEPMFTDFVLHEVVRTDRPALSKVWQVFFMGESSMQTAINVHEKDLQTRFPTCAVSYQAHLGYATYTVTFFPQNAQEETQFRQILLHEYDKKVTEAFNHHILFCEDLTLAAYIDKKCAEHSLKLFFLESSCFGAFGREFSRTSRTSYLGSYSSADNDTFNLSLLKKEPNIFISEKRITQNMESGTEDFFEFSLHFEKNIKFNPEKCIEILKPFFTLCELVSTDSNYNVLTCSVKINSRFDRFIQESRGVNHVLGSLCLLLNNL